MHEKTPNCLLCDGADTRFYYQDRRRSYFRCPTCHLIFVPPAEQLSKQAENERYQQHQNDPDQIGYRRFLQKAIDPLLPMLRPGARGIDYGCGPGRVLTRILAEKGYPTVGYDPVFADDQRMLWQTYDFLTCTEVFEHLREPAAEFVKMRSLVRKGGWMAVMTQLTDGLQDFGTWHYISDPTHIGFYSRSTFDWLVKSAGLAMTSTLSDVILIQC